MLAWQIQPSGMRRRRFALAGSAFIALCLVALIYHQAALHGLLNASPYFSSQDISSSFFTPSHSPSTYQSEQRNPLLLDQAKFWRANYQIILNNDPQCQKKPEIVVPTDLDIAYQDDHYHHRPDIMWMDEPDIQRMKIAHSNFISDIKASQSPLVYNKGSRGIITTVSDQAMPVFLVSLRMIRQSGSTLPIEVFLWRATPYTEHICTSILSDLNATCVYLSTIFNAAGTGVGIESYQFKVFAILFSSFDEVLFLDADAWSASNPDPLFDSPPFTDTGLVLWPDFWYSSESPYFFQIAKIQNPPNLADRASTEAGALMYSKSKHELSIMLAMYYNYYGPEYYYPLQSQGAPGQGDKETFGLAAMALGEPFYAVKTTVTAMGRTDSNGVWYGSAMIQYDPYIDFLQRGSRQPSASGSDVHPDDKSASELTPVPSEEFNYHDKHDNSPPSVVSAAESFANSTIDIATSKVLFIHANFPKFDPRTIFEEEVNGAHTPTRDSNGTNVRCWSMEADVAIERFGYDIEKSFWTVIKKVACHDLIGTGLTGKDEQAVCRRVTNYMAEIF